MSLALALWAALILVLTLGPTVGSGHATDAIEVVCLICGDRGTADLVLNVALFVPFGWMAGKRWGGLRASLLALALSAAVEAAQMAIPGRFPTLGDVVANVTGAVVGARLVGRESVALAGSAGLAALAALSPLVLLAPDPPEGVYYGQWTARFGDMAHYGGRVVSATLGGIDVPSGRSDRSVELRDALTVDGPVVVTFVAGPRPPELAPLFSIFDGRQREVFLMGVDRADLVVRRWLRARSLRLDSPELRWEGALADVRPGTPVRLRFGRVDHDLCLAVDGRTRCDLAPAQGSGWSHLMGVGGGSVRFRRLAGAVFMMGLGVLLGLPAWSTWARVASLSTTALAGWTVPGWLPHVTSSTPQALALLLGGLAGLVLRARVLGARPVR